MSGLDIARTNRAIRRLMQLLEARGAIGAADAQEIEAMIGKDPRGIETPRRDIPHIETKG